ncbi:MAG: QueT transporter family protein [Lachnospiraceae bacterium]|nr:QueT transporter family protein [Lachnospiraceae bacterium]
MKKNKILFITQAAIIAALYVVLTYLANLLGLASGAIQVRFSEALTVLPAFMPSAIPGLFIGCLLSNILTSANILDIVFGSLATLLGALGTYILARKIKWLAPIPPIASNGLIIPLVLKFGFGLDDAYWFLLLTVTAGEIISCGIFGTIVTAVFKKYKKELHIEK